LSYVIDIKRGKFEPTRDIIVFATYVAFFPCILSGPIDRPATLIPQLKNRRIFDYSIAVDGMRQILWGLFKKVVIADNCAVYVNEVFGGSYQLLTGSTLLLTAAIFSFQMYADFSGYTDMAIGVAKLLGIRVTKNFDYPFFAQNIAEYWRKWHISLTSWLTDYVFMPLNVRWRDWGNWGTIAAIMITFILIGLWHGDNWTFAFFGLYEGLLYIPLILTGAMFKKNKLTTYQWGFPKPKVLINILLTFGLVTVGNVIFRADSIGQAFEYLWGITNGGWFYVVPGWRQIVCFISFMLIVEWIQRQKQHGLDLSGINSHVLKFVIYYILIATIFIFGRQAETFIYFQF
jgi:D-alanyl-lipoteichoic acid acyltransferase DltB (MBOAT superfamily)